MAQVDRMFRGSGLMRPKWDEKRGERTYGERTLAAAADGDLYTPRVVKPASPRAAAGPSAAPQGQVDDDGGDGMTDRANAVRLRVAHGRDLRWVDRWQDWLIWDGKRWATRSRYAVRARAVGVMLTLRREALKDLREVRKAPAEDDREKKEKKAEMARLKRLADWAEQSQNRKPLDDMVDLLRSETGVEIRHSGLDADPWALNCANGTLDLRTGALRPHRREDMLTKMCPHAYRPEARCPAWEQALLAIFGGSEALVAYLRRLAGYCLTGDVREAVLPVFWGSGSNGKSLVFEVLRAALGRDYGMVGARELLGGDDRDRHPAYLADLFGMRLVTLAETREGGRLNETLIKELTGGESIKARRMREDFWEFTPTHKILLATNHKPQIKGTDHGIWRRVRLVPFTVRFWGPDKGETGPEHLRADKGLKAKLLSECEGVLAWCVRGCREWLEGGLQDPPEVLMATREYRAEQDVIAAFLDERCAVRPDQKVRAQRLYDRYTEWHKKSGVKDSPLSLKCFGEDISSRDGITKKSSNGVWYLGVDLLTPFEVDE